MKFKKLDFQDHQARIVYNMYISNVKKLIKRLPDYEKEDILMELNSHIYEAIQNGKENDEYNIINEITSRLGEPDEMWLKTEIDFRLEQINSMKPKIPFIEQFGLATLYGLTYFLMIMSVVLIGGKLYFGSTFGFFINPGKAFVLGGIEDGALNTSEHEVLGIWYIPVFLLFFIVTRYIIIQLKKDEKSLILKYSCD